MEYQQKNMTTETVSWINRNVGRWQWLIVGALLSATVVSVGCVARHPVNIASPSGVNAIERWRIAAKAALTDTLTTAPTTDQGKRNFALSYSEALVMGRYGAIRNNLMNGRAATAVTLDVINLGLTATVPIVNGSRGKTILGSIATGLQGTQSSIDRNVFQQQTTGAILAAMDTCVTRQRRVLGEHRLLPVPQYDEYDVYGDLVQLYGCTTLAGAVQELTETQAIESRNTRQTLVPVSDATVSEFRSIQSAFIESVDGDKKAALGFLTRLKVQGLTEASSKEQFIAAYRGLLAAAGSNDEFRKAMQDAAQQSGLTGHMNQ